MHRHSRSSNFFQTKKKQTIDFVIVVESSIKNNQTHFKYVNNYITYLQERGLQFEIHQTKPGSLVFIMLSLSKAALKHFAVVYNIDITSRGHMHLPQGRTFIPNMFDTPLTTNDRDMFVRRKGARNMERILVVTELLNDAVFDYYAEDMYGLSKLKKLKAVKDAYPLHDGDCNYAGKKDAHLNDRELLLKYWANFSLWYKKQPINLVEKYYGTEIAFYFAWLGFYNKMLIPAALVGLLCFLISASCLREESLLSQHCHSNTSICSRCHVHQPCKTAAISSTCTYTKIQYMFDNGITFFFSIFMSFWASLFLKLWDRMEHILKVRWNVEYVEANTRVRLEYKNKATAVKTVPVTGDFEAVIPTSKRVLYKTVSYAAILLLLIVVLTVLVGLTFYRIYLTFLLEHLPWFNSDYILMVVIVTAAIIQVVFIKLYGKFYAPLSILLTKIENPRTQAEFDKSVIVKRFFLGFANNYTPLFYIAFVKNRMHNPLDPNAFLGLQKDVCPVSGCLLGLLIQLAFLMFFKSMAGNILTLLRPSVCALFKKKKVLDPFSILSQHEIEYDLESSDEYLLTSEFMEMIIQYGFLTFFVPAFPLAPLCALVNNIMELRLDAYKFVKRHRRPVPKRQAGIGTWNAILKAITVLSTVTNAFVLAFTSDYMKREFYKYTHGGVMSGYVNSTLSALEVLPIVNNSYTICYIASNIHPPGHPKQYTLTDNYVFGLGVRFSTVFIFEHLIMIFGHFVLYFLPELPMSVKLKIQHRNELDRAPKLKELYENVREAEDRHADIHIRKTTVKF